MTGKEFRYVRETVENEGFDYAFRSYSDFKDKVTDPEFHRLREEYVSAANKLEAYCGLEDAGVEDDSDDD